MKKIFILFAFVICSITNSYANKSVFSKNNQVVLSDESTDRNTFIDSIEPDNSLSVKNSENENNQKEENLFIYCESASTSGVINGNFVEVNVTVCSTNRQAAKTSAEVLSFQYYMALSGGL